MSEMIEVSAAPLLPQQVGDQFIAVRNGAIVRVTIPAPESTSLALVARSGYYGDLSGLPDLSLAALGAATAAQGQRAETAVQPEGLAVVATSGAYADLTGLPDLSLAALGAATAAQGQRAETAVQPEGLAVVATSGAYADLTGLPDLSLAALGAATAAQGQRAETALQPAAIAAFETSTQLNARDTENRKRLLHTGVQAISTVAGLQTALDSKANQTALDPILARLGFDYVGATEPTSPANGFRWLEIVSGNLRGEWEWISSVGEWISLTSYEITSPSSNGNTNAIATLVDFSSRKRFVVDIYVQTNATGTWGASSSIDVRGILATALTGGTVLNTPNTTITTTGYNQTIHSIRSVYTFGRISLGRNNAISAGALTATVDITVRDCRV